MKKILTICILAMLLNSCKKSNDTIDPTTIDYLAFGTSYGMCVGDCAKLFSIAGGNLYPDNLSYYSGNLTFSNTPLPASKYQLAKELLDSFPTYFLNTTTYTFGCPDCADQGAIHIQLKQNGVIRTWHIDTSVANQPIEIRSYIARLISILNQL